MREHALHPPCRRRLVATADSGHREPDFPDRSRDGVIDGPNELWVADLTYTAIIGGFVYLAAIMDAWSRRIVGYALGRRIDARLFETCAPWNILPPFISVASGEEPCSRSHSLERGRGKPAPSVTGGDKMVRAKLDSGSRYSTPVHERPLHPTRSHLTPEASQTQAPVTPATEPEQRTGGGSATLRDDEAWDRN